MNIERDKRRHERMSDKNKWMKKKTAMKKKVFDKNFFEEKKVRESSSLTFFFTALIAKNERERIFAFIVIIFSRCNQR